MNQGMEGEAAETHRPPHTADLSTSEDQLKQIDLRPCICQAVIQAMGDLDEDKASIAKMTF